MLHQDQVSDFLVNGDTLSNSHFPYKLHAMLQYAANSEYSSAVSWVDEGRAFAIRDKKVLMENVAPLFFKQSQFRSFSRQLNLWGFKRFQRYRMDAKATWRHPHFLRDDTEALKSIIRVEIKSKADEEPVKKIRKKSKKSRRLRSKEAPKPTAVRAATPGDSSNDESPSSLLSSPPISAASISSTQGDMLQALLLSNAQYQVQTQIVRQLQPPVPTMAQSIPPAFVQAVHIQSPSMITSSSYCTEIYQSVSSKPMIHDDSSSQSNQQGNDDMLSDSDQKAQVASNEDLLLLLSGLFETEETSHGDDDLSSVLSVNGLPGDLLDPISF